jgi:DNA ligase D-like protein (predicted polymerase)
VAISNPDKVLFPGTGHTKLDLARYYLAVADGALRGAGGRPNVLVRHPNGVGGEFFFQKRAPSSRPPWIEIVSLSFPSGRTAEEIVPRDAAALAWMANLACLELHPHPVRADDLDHPDELRVDLDPVPGVDWAQVRGVAHVVHETLDQFTLAGWPKTSASRHPRLRADRAPLGLRQVRRAASPSRARSSAARPAWRRANGGRKSVTHGVSLDYNQNAKDRTIASAYSVRPTADARVSARRSPGTRSIPAIRPTSRSRDAGPVRGDRRSPRRDRRASVPSIALELSAKQGSDGEGRATPLGRRTTATARRAGAGPAVEAAHVTVIR